MKLVVGLYKATGAKGSKKGSKKGLVPVQKQVTKKGKTFTQTFYVKPSSPAPVIKPAVLKTNAGVKNKAKAAPKPSWNMPDGFYLRVIGGGYDKRVRVPDNYVHAVFEHRGFKWVVAPAISGSVEEGQLTLMGDKWQVYAFDSGIKSTSYYFDDPVDGLKELTERLKSFSDESVASVISHATPIEKIRNVYSDDLFFASSPNTPYEDITPHAYGVIKALSKQEPHNSPPQMNDMVDWMREFANTPSTVQELYEGIGGEINMEAMRTAVNMNIDISDAVNFIYNIDNLLNAAVDGGNTIVERDITVWASKYGFDLTDRDALPDIDMINGYGDEVYGVTIVANAIVNGISVSEARAKMAPTISSFEDSSGHEWEERDLDVLGHWVTGSVKNNRTTAKEIFNQRQIPDHDDSGYLSDSLLKILENHLVDFKEDDFYSDKECLWRGSLNQDWAMAEPGTVIPIGIASFTPSLSVAEGFTGSKMDSSDDFDKSIILRLSKSVTAPIVGVDIHRLIDDAEEAGASKLIEKTSVNRYYAEKEFLTVIPAVRVVKVEYDENLRRVVVDIEPTDMNLVKYLKSRFESKSDLIASLESTFDYSMHDEPREK